MPTPDAKPLHTDVNALSVLLVEDSPLLSERLLELISGIDRVQTLGVVATERDAIHAINTHHPDAIVLDLRLKEGTGFGVVRHINTLPERPTVVIITNYALPQYRRQAESLGVQYFLDKTQEFDRLPQLLRDMQHTLHS